VRVIDIRTSVIGDREILETLRRAPNEINFCLLEEMVEIGTGITDDARSSVPVRRGKLRDAIRFKVTTPAGHLKLEVKHTGVGARHAHLVERGVERQTVEVHRKVMAQRLRFKSGKTKRGRKFQIRNESTFLYTRSFGMAAHPYFMPAVEKAGDVGARLQGAVSSAAEKLKGAGA
jgi:hypothetical protein